MLVICLVVKAEPLRMNRMKDTVAQVSFNLSIELQELLSWLSQVCWFLSKIPDADDKARGQILCLWYLWPATNKNSWSTNRCSRSLLAEKGCYGIRGSVVEHVRGRLSIPSSSFQLLLSTSPSQ